MRRCGGGLVRSRRALFGSQKSSSSTPAAAVPSPPAPQRSSILNGRSVVEHDDESLAWAKREPSPLLWKPEEWHELMNKLNWESCSDQQNVLAKSEVGFDGFMNESVADSAAWVQEEDLEETTCLYKTWLDSWGAEDATATALASSRESNGVAQRRQARLLERQKEIEEQTLLEAERAYVELMNDMVRMGGAAKIKPIEKLMVTWFQPLVEKITGARSAALLGDTTSYRDVCGPLLMLLTPEQLAVITMHTVIGRCLKAGSVGDPVTKIVLEIAEFVQAEVRMTKLKQKHADDVEKLKSMPRLTQSSLSSAQKAATTTNKADAAHSAEAAAVHSADAAAATAESLTTTLFRHRSVDPLTLVQGLSSHLVNWKARKLLLGDDDANWPQVTKAKLGAALLDMFLQVCDEVSPGNTYFIHTLQETASPLASGKSNVKRTGVIKASPDVLNLVESSDVAKSALLPRYLPMLVEPAKWRGYDDGGYLTLRAVLMRTNGYLPQAKAVRRMETSMPAFVDAINSLGRVPWKVNKAVLDVVQECWDSKIEMPYVPSRFDHDIPSEPQYANDADGADIKKAVREWKRRVSKLEQKNAELHSLRCDLTIKLTIAQRFADEEKIYFPYNVDFRGRAYPIPQNLNHLGSDVCRAMLTFAESKPLGEKGFYWLKVHLGNLFGLSKKSLDERAAFAEENLEKILDSADDPLGGGRWWADAEDAWQALAACFEIAAALRHPGGVSNYECSLPIHADGSCNGLQHYASLGRDEEGGRQVNLLPGDKPLDVYSGVCDMIVKKLDEIVENGLSETSSEKEEEELQLARIVQGMVNRKVVKQTVMTSVYGVTFIGARDQVHARIQEIVEDLMKAPSSEERDARLANFTKMGLVDEITGEINEKILRKCSTFVARLTLDGISELFTSARLIMKWLADCATIIAQDGQTVSWITPLGLPVVQPYRSHSSYQVRTILQKLVLIDKSENLPVSTARNKSAFPPNFVHSLDSTHMLMTATEMERRNLTFAAVHDSFWTHAANVDEMQSTLRRAFLDLYSQPILEQLNESFEMRYPHLEFPPLPPRGTLDIRKILEADYFFS